MNELPQWDAILTPEKRKELYKSQKASGTVRKAKKIFPNDPPWEAARSQKMLR